MNAIGFHVPRDGWRAATTPDAPERVARRSSRATGPWSRSTNPTGSTCFPPRWCVNLRRALQALDADADVRTSRTDRRRSRIQRRWRPEDDAGRRRTARRSPRGSPMWAVDPPRVRRHRPGLIAGSDTIFVAALERRSRRSWPGLAPTCDLVIASDRAVIVPGVRPPRPDPRGRHQLGAHPSSRLPGRARLLPARRPHRCRTQRFGWGSTGGRRARPGCWPPPTNGLRASRICRRTRSR